MILVLCALAADPAFVRQEGVVAEAAAAVARARSEGLRPARIAELMATYRREAEHLAELQPPEDAADTAGAREAALRSLSDATARGASDDGARAVVETWLGPLAPRLDVLAAALDAAEGSPADLARPIAADVESQAVAVLVTATYDASRADAAGRQARTRLALLQATPGPMERVGLEVEVEVRALQLAMDFAAASARAHRSLADRAVQLRDRARPIWEE